ncbi:MAG: hypothetical protein H6537_08560 [Bacteroidales bacterium]|nr:hypothetical protein [Bacteroidales bacterium]
MKAIKKIFFLSFIAMLVLYVVTNITFDLIVGKEVNWINIASSGLVISIVYSLIYYGGISVTLKPKYNYLESEELNEPIFGDKLEKTTKLKNIPFDFNEVKNKIQEKWRITYFDSRNNIIKYRSKMKFNSWGVGGFLKIDNETAKIISFPIVGYSRRDNKLVTEMIELTEKIINK